MRRLLITLVLMLAAPAWGQESLCRPLPSPMTGPVFAQSGNSVIIRPDGDRYEMITLRLRGLGVPTMYDRATGIEHALGMQSRAALAALLSNTRTARCSPVGRDALCRLYAECTTGDAHIVTLSWLMLESGWAYVDMDAGVNTSVDADQLHAAEKLAREARRGLWRVWLPPEQR